MGLYEVLRALGVGQDDEVILPGFTCAVVVNAVRFTGARPVYADIELSRLGADVEQIRKAISDKTKAIVVHHLFGIPCDIEPALELGRATGIPIIEDAAMAMGGRFKDRLLGTFGQASILSCERNKMISTGNGGILLVNNEKTGQAVAKQYECLSYPASGYARLSMQAWLCIFLNDSPFLGYPYGKVIRQIKKVRRTLGKPWHFECEGHDSNIMYADEFAGIRPEGYPWKMCGELTWLLLRQFRRLDEQVRHRCELAAELQHVLTRKGAAAPRIDWGTMQPAWLRFPFWVDDPDRWRTRLQRLGIECGNWFEGPVHPAECCDNPWFCYEAGTCPQGEWLGKRILNIPTTPRIGRWLLTRIRRM
jgi:dTDP-4-amino-4,6-dideoxygalactose transaminase